MPNSGSVGRFLRLLTVSQRSLVTTRRLCSSEAAQRLKEALHKHQVVPDVVPRAPNSVLKVCFDTGAEVKLGNILTPTQVQRPPSILLWDNLEPHALYTIIMTDPDAPSREDPKFREWHHWMLNNVPGNDLTAGHETSAYIGSGPPEGTGLHRYVYLAFKQPKKLPVPSLPTALSAYSADGRPSRPAMRIISNLGMSIDDLVAANFYLAEWDNYVPLLYEQLSGKRV